MTTDNAIRFLHYEASRCRDRDAHEALCLLLPSLLRLMHLEPMEDVEAAAFRYQFRQEIAALPFQDATDRADQARPVKLAQSMRPSGCGNSEGHNATGARCPGASLAASSA